MMDENMKRYCEQMDKVILSDAADETILEDILKADAQKGVGHVKRAKRTVSAAMVAAAIVMASSVTVFAGAVIHKIMIESNKEESYLQGIGTADVGESYYYDFLAGDAGELYVLTDNDQQGVLTDHHAIAWKSVDQGDTWEEVLSWPGELNGEIALFAGDLREGETGIEAIVLVEEKITGRRRDTLTGYIRLRQIPIQSMIWMRCIHS